MCGINTSSLFNSLISWLVDKDLPYRIDAPPGVFVNLFSQEKKYILHLINYTGTNYEHPHSQIEYISPVKNISCKIKVPRKVKEVRTIVPKESLEYSENEGYLLFTLPVLQANDIVVIQYG